MKTSMLDTLKLQFPLDCVRDIMWEDCPRTIIPYRQPDDSIVNHEYLVSNARDRGGAYFKIDYAAKTGFLEFSAKTLGRDYLRGISESTLDHSLETIRKLNSGLVLDPDRLARSAVVLRADACANIPVANPKREYVEAVKLALNWKQKRRQSTYEKSALWYSSNEELSVYDKQSEIKTDKRLYELIYDEVQNIVRIEYRSKNKRTISKRYGHEGKFIDYHSAKVGNEPMSREFNPRLSEILPAHRNHSVLLNVWSGLERTEIGLFDVGVFESMQELGTAQAVKLHGYLTIWNACQQSEEMFRSWIRNTSPQRSATRYIREGLELIKKSLYHKKLANDRIDELTEKLSKIEPLGNVA